MRARVCVLADVSPRVIVVVKEHSSVWRSLIGCAVLGMLKGYDKRACIPTNLNYGLLRRWQKVRTKSGDSKRRKKSCAGLPPRSLLFEPGTPRNYSAATDVGARWGERELTATAILWTRRSD